MPDLWVFILSATLVICAVFLLLFTIKYYSLALFLICFSPWISAISVEQGLDGGPSLGSYLRIGLLLMLAITGIIIFIKNSPDNLRSIPVQFYLLAFFILFAILSTIYSIDQQYTVIRSFTFLAIFCSLLGIYAWLNSEKRFSILLNTMFYVVVLFALLNIISFSMSSICWYFYGGYRFMGFWGHPNVLGSLSLITYPILIWKAHHSTTYRRLFIFLLMSLVFIMHFLTGSRGSLVAAFLGIIIWLLISRKYISLFALFSFAIIVIIFVISLKPDVFIREDSSSYLTGTTGRTDFWLAAMVLIKEHPLHGYGYAVEGKVWVDPRFNDSELFLWSGTARSSLHNGYISLLISLGIPGFLLWCNAVFIPFFRGFTLSATTYKAYVMATMGSCLALNFIETLIIGNGAIAALFFWIAWALLSRLLEFEKNKKDRLTEPVTAEVNV